MYYDITTANYCQGGMILARCNSCSADIAQGRIAANGCWTGELLESERSRLIAFEPRKLMKIVDTPINKRSSIFLFKGCLNSTKLLYSAQIELILAIGT